MPNPKDFIERARMFEERAGQARDPISRHHYRCAIQGLVFVLQPRDKLLFLGKQLC
jgi:hypothetical protein